MTCDHVFALGVEVAEMVADHPLLTLRRHLLEGGGVQELPRPSDNSHSVTFVSEPPLVSLPAKPAVLNGQGDVIMCSSQ